MTKLQNSIKLFIFIREREIEERLRKQEEEARRAAEEKERWGRRVSVFVLLLLIFILKTKIWQNVNCIIR